MQDLHPGSGGFKAGRNLGCKTGDLPNVDFFEIYSRYDSALNNLGCKTCILGLGALKQAQKDGFLMISIRFPQEFHIIFGDFVRLFRNSTICDFLVVVGIPRS